MILNNMKWEKGLFTVVHQIKQLSWMPPILQTAYMWICYYSNQEWYCFPSQKLLAENCWVSINAIRKYLAELENIWLIKRERRYKDNMELSSIYQLVIGISTGGGGVYQQVGEGIAPDGDGTISTELNLKELDIPSEKEENKQIQDTKTKKKKVHDYSSLENDPEDSFAKEAYLTLKKMWWNESIPLQEFIEYIDAFLVSKDISKQKWDFIKWQLWLKDFLIYWSNDKSTKKPNYLLKMRNSPSFTFNQKQYAKR